MPDSSSLQREVEAETRRLFPAAVRRVEWLGYGDSPLIEPGEISSAANSRSAGLATHWGHV